MSVFLKPVVSKTLVQNLKWLEQADEISGRCDPGPPLVEGDLFTSVFEGPSRYKVLECRTSGIRASCLISFESGSSKDLYAWRDRALMIHEDGGWVVSDFERLDSRSHRLLSSEISSLIAGTVATCPNEKWPSPEPPQKSAVKAR